MPRLPALVRGLLRERAFTAAVLLTLSLGTGVCLAVFGIVQAVLLEPLPLPEADRLAAVWMTNPRQGFDRDVVSYPQFRDWRDQSRAQFVHLAAFATQTATVSANGGAREVRICQVSDEFFDVLRAQPALGRTLTRDDYDRGERALVLSDALWRTAFGGEREIVGRTIRLNTEQYLVVGVLPAGVTLPTDAEMWTPLIPEPETRAQFESRGSLWLAVIGRLAPGVRPQAAQDALTVVERRLAQTYPDGTQDTGVLVRPLHDDLVGTAARPLWLLQGAVAVVLLIACANVSNLLLARASARQRELATRVALGATWRQIISEGFLETLLLTGAGSLLGLLLASWLMDLARVAGPALPFQSSVSVAPQVVGGAVALCLLTALLVGIVPLLRQARADAGDALRVGGRVPGHAGGSARFRQALVAGQIALALILLSGAGLLIKSFTRLLALDTGYTTENALTGSVTLASGRSRDAAVWAEMLRSVGEIPGVSAVGAVSAVLYGRLPAASPIAVEGRPDLPEELTSLPVVIASATPGYFEAVGHPLLRGRDIDPRDSGDASRVVVVNEALGATFFGTTDVVGRRVTFGDPRDARTAWLTIVGMVKDIRRSSVGPEFAPRPEVYIPVAQRPRPSMTLVVRTEGEPTAFAGAIAAAVARVDADVPVSRVQPLARLLAVRLDQRRFLVSLAGAFAIVAVLLSVIGIYGVASYAVTQRQHDFGVYLALGAPAGTVVRLVLAQGLGVAVAGAAVGAAGARAVAALLTAQLYEVNPADPWVLSLVTILLLAITGVACWLPARRAARVDVMRVLRPE